MQHAYSRACFYDLAIKYCKDISIADAKWNELELQYNGAGRFYHTLNHISGIIAVLDTSSKHVDCLDALQFAAFYHDAIYDVLKNDNEERSAALADQRLAELSVPTEIAGLCHQHILATKRHEQSTCSDTNLFTDADLAILGGVPALYQEYCRNIRQEYSIYPDDVYRAGRIKVLEHFLAMPRIYKTDFFRERYEVQARENIKTELAELINRASFRA